jgi:hypothetical protein
MKLPREIFVGEIKLIHGDTCLNGINDVPEKG